ncbi:MAG: right-handed parallel beta-helix repeat-containing protein [archaeon]|nr:MAG: right-handed parallel beta-helix repeat-containing protein [archaeon]
MDRNYFSFSSDLAMKSANNVEKCENELKYTGRSLIDYQCMVLEGLIEGKIKPEEITKIENDLKKYLNFVSSKRKKFNESNYNLDVENLKDFVNSKNSQGYFKKFKENHPIAYKATKSFGTFLTLFSLCGGVAAEAFSNSESYSSEENVITVDDEPGDAMFTKIQDAIDNASIGDTIKVFGGIYPENVFLDKTLNLIGVKDIKDNETIPVIDAQRNGSAIYLTADNCLVDGFELIKAPVTIPGTGNVSAGIKVTSNGNVFKNNNILMNKYYGIYLVGVSKNNKILRNSISQNNGGIMVSKDSKDNEIYENLISDNDGSGIRVEDKNKIYKNKLYSNYMGIFVGVGNIGVSNTEIFENYFIDNHIGLEMYYSDNNHIQKNTFKGNRIGVKLDRSDGNHINNNNFIKNDLHATFKGVLYADPWAFSLTNYPDGINNDWEENYWNRTRIFPKIILGTGWYYYWNLPPSYRIVFDFDLHPLREPYKEN